MNQQVKEELQRKVNDYMDANFAEFKKQIVKSIKPSDNICTDQACLNQIGPYMNEVVRTLSLLAKSHGINSYDMIEAVFKMTLDGNEYCRKLEKTAEAFKDDRFVGFC